MGKIIRLNQGSRNRELMGECTHVELDAVILFDNIINRGCPVCAMKGQVKVAEANDAKGQALADVVKKVEEEVGEFARATEDPDDKREISFLEDLRPDMAKALRSWVGGPDASFIRLFLTLLKARTLSEHKFLDLFLGTFEPWVDGKTVRLRRNNDDESLSLADWLDDLVETLKERRLGTTEDVSAERDKIVEKLDGWQKKLEEAREAFNK